MNIIEFNGLPGVGKSTLCNSLINELSNKSILIADLGDIVFRNQKTKLDNYFYIMKVIFSIKRINFNMAVFKFTLDYRLSKSNIVYALRLIKLYNKLKTSMEKDEFKYIILEEGIVQYITSIPHDKLIRKNENFYKLCDIIKKDFEDILQINCLLNVTELLKRIRNRNSLKNRFDTLPEDELKRVLKIKNENIKLVRNIFNNEISIDTKKRLDENLNIILSRIS